MANTTDSRPNPPSMPAPTRKPDASTPTGATNADVRQGDTATNALRTRARPPSGPPATQDLGRYLRTEASAPDGEPPPGVSATGSPDYNADGTIRDMEKSLVERIADVDDDRRRTATHLQKAFNTHRDETRAEVRRWRLRLSFVLALWVLLLAAGLGGLAWQAAQSHQALRAELAALWRAVDTLRTSDVRAPAADPAAAIADQVDSRLDAFETEQRRLAAQLGELASAQQEQQQASAPATLPIDALIDQQLSRLEREYQRLAQQVASAAVAPASGPDAAGQDRADALAPPTRAVTDPAPEGAAEPGNTAATATGPTDTIGTGTGQDVPTDAGPAGTPETGQQGATETGTDAEDPPDAGAADPSGAIERVGERRFALQLIGFHSRAELDAFCARNPLPAQVYTREEVFRDRPWHVLIHSLHPDLETATAATAALPETLSGLDLWIRSLLADDELEVITPPPQ